MAKGNPARQKMINMMYLVLTALLALNVSKEVLNSFFEVNKGIERTTTNFTLKNGDTYAEFDNAVLNNPEKYKAVRDKAYSLKKQADAIVDSLQRMKYDLVLAVDKKVYLGSDKDFRDEDGELIKEKAKTVNWNQLDDEDKNKAVGFLNGKDNREQSGQLFYYEKAAKIGKEQPATTRKREMESLRTLLLSLSEGNDRLQTSISTNFDFSDRKEDNWEKYNFHDMPAVSALTLLSKMQSDIRNAEANVIDYLKKDIDAKSLKFGDAEGVEIPKSNFIIQGDSFRSTIFIAAKQEGQEPEIWVGDVDSLGDGKYEMRGEYEEVKVINGKGYYAKRTLSEGQKKWGGLIRMKTEKGLKEYPFSGEYLVASKQAVASPVNMNVLYVAVDNPIKLAVAGYSASQVTATTRNGTIKVVNKNKGQWVVRPTKRNDNNAPVIDLFVTVDGKRKPMGSVEFKVKEVPEPNPKAAGIPDNKKVVSKGELRAAQMLIAEMKDFYFDRNAVSYRVVSYDITYTNTQGQFTKQIKGAKFDDQVLQAINNTRVGNSITFSNIVVKRPGVPKRDLPYAKIYTIK